MRRLGRPVGWPDNGAIGDFFVKVEFLVDIVPRDVPVGAALQARLGSDPTRFAITPTFFGDGNGRATLLQSLRLRPDALVTPWYNADRTLEIWARAWLSGARLVHFPSEQFFSHAFDDEKLNLSCVAAYRRQVDAVFVWGEYYARRLVEDVGFPPERIYEVGSPRLEFARDGHVPAPREDGGPQRVLFVSDFTIADLHLERERERFARTFGVSLSGAEVEQLGRERRYMLDTARAAAREQNVEVRVRPHPGENMQPYREACAGATLQYADPSRPFAEDLSWADVVVGYTSTSVFEVLAAGRTFIALRSEPPPPLMWRDALEALYTKYTAETLMERLGDDGAPAPDDATIVRARYCIGNLDGSFDPVDAVTSALEKLGRAEATARPDGWDRLRAYYGAARAVAKYIAFRLFASGLWRRLGLWQPAPVRNRLSPGHALCDEIVEGYREAPVAARSAMPSVHGAVEWRLGEWCWSPVPRVAEECRDDGKPAPATAGSLGSVSREG